MHVTTTAAIYTIRFSITLVKFSSLFIPYSDVVENTMSDIQSNLYTGFQELYPIVLHILHLLFCEHYTASANIIINQYEICIGLFIYKFFNDITNPTKSLIYENRIFIIA